MGLKGMVFTLMAILLIALAVGMVTVPYTAGRQKSQSILNGRMQSMNMFIHNIEHDAEVAAYTASFRGVIALIEEISNTGAYIDDVDAAMHELMMNATLDGDTVFVMQNNTLENWTAKIREQADKIGIDLDMDITDIWVYHEDPWHLTTKVAFRCQLDDDRGLASWDFPMNITSRLQIERFSDPLWIVETGNQLARTVNMTPYEENFTEGAGTGNIRDHIEKGYYLAFSAAPSFKKRLEGDLSPDPNGIESLVDKQELEIYMPVDETKTAVDHIYFGDQDPDAYTFTNMPSKFALDNLTNSTGMNRIALYNLSHLVT